MNKRITSLFLALALLCSGILSVRANAIWVEPLVLHSSKSASQQIRYYYDWDGRCVRAEWLDSDRYTEYTYDDSGVLIQERSYEEGELTAQTDYDAQGNAIAKWETDYTGKLKKKITYSLQYDEFGRVIFSNALSGVGHHYNIRNEYDYYESENPIFGRWEQDGNIGNGPEPIEWEILQTTDHYTMLISKYGLECQYFYETDIEVSWERSDLRGWLNANFLYSAFTEEEQAQIVPVAPDKGGEEDHIYLLSSGEVLWCYPQEADRICQPTQYAINQDAYVSTANGGSRWLLRNSGTDARHVRRVNADGSIDYQGGMVSDTTSVLRPVLWVYKDAPHTRSDQVCRKTINNYTDDAQTGERNYIESYMETYDQAGRIIYMRYTYAMGMPGDGQYSWEYDEQGNLIENRISFLDIYSETGEYVEELHTYTNEYNSRSQLTKVTEYYKGKPYSSTIYDYDEYGNQIFREVTDHSGNVTTETWEYDRYGNLLKAAINGDITVENVYVPLFEAIWK